MFISTKTIFNNTVQQTWHLALPILPGRVERWRRFAQEINGSRQAEFSAWCQRYSLSFPRWELIDAVGCAVVLLQVNAPVTPTLLPQLAKGNGRFERWFLQQIMQLHGINLARISKAVLPTESTRRGAHS